MKWFIIAVALIMFTGVVLIYSHEGSAPVQKTNNVISMEIPLPIATSTGTVVNKRSHVTSTLQEASTTPATIDKNYIYHNPTLGFHLRLPNAMWYMQPDSDKDPHLYINQKCSNDGGSNCPALEIQFHGNEGVDKKDIDSYFSATEESGLHPIKQVSLIPGAVVIKSNAEGPAEGWKYEYKVFFQKEKKRYLVFTNDLSLEKNILPSFRLGN